MPVYDQLVAEIPASSAIKLPVAPIAVVVGAAKFSALNQKIPRPMTIVNGIILAMVISV